MKRALIAVAGVLAATSLFASDPPQTTTAAAPAATKAAAQEDSPLVRAAKKSTRSKSKRIVITNEDLKNSQGHITTTTVPPKALNIPEPEKGTEQLLLESKAKEKERAAQRDNQNRESAEKQKLQTAKRVSAAEDDGHLDDDPAQTEQRLDHATSTAAKPDGKTEQPPKKQ